MPSRIPYDPTLVLGNTVPKDTLDKLTEISHSATPADDAEADRRSALEAMKRSLEMTARELEAMGIDATALRQQIAALQIPG